MRIRLAVLAALAALVVAALGAQSALASGSFAPTGSMSIVRARAGAAPLANGQALLAGGTSATTSDVASAEIFNAGRFSSTGAMSVPRGSPVAAPLLDGRVLVAGGLYTFSDSNGDRHTTTWQSAEIFDPATGSFAPTGSMTTPRAGAVAAPLPDGRVLVAGGIDFDPPSAPVDLRSAEIFDPATGSFTPTGSMRVARFEAAAAPLPDGRVLVAGGSCSLGPCDTRGAEIFDPATGSFSPTGNMTIPRGYGLAAAPLPDGRVLIVGGLGNFVGGLPNTQSAETFDPDSGTFAPAAATTVARIETAAASLADGRVLVAGTAGLPPEGNSAELFTPGLSSQLSGRKLTATVAVAGTLTAADVRNRHRLLKSTSTSGGPGQITVKLKPTARGKKTLQRKRKLRVGARLGFAPAPVRGGCVTLTGPCYSPSSYAISETATLTLKAKKRR